jgi:hypothetical protein
VTAGSFRDLEYELRAGLNCVTHKRKSTTGLCL